MLFDLRRQHGRLPVEVHVMRLVPEELRLPEIE